MIYFQSDIKPPYPDFSFHHLHIPTWSHSSIPNTQVPGPGATSLVYKRSSWTYLHFWPMPSHPPMPLLDTASTSYVSIRLAEPVVFIRNDVASSSRLESNARTSIVRGLLTVHFVKPTRVASIDVELSAKTSNAWPEDVGSRRVDVTEEHEVYSASTTYFQAGAPSRRHVSLGPGILPHEDDTEWDHTGPSRNSLDDHSHSSHIRPSTRRFSSSGHTAAAPLSVSLAPPGVAEPSPPYTPTDNDDVRRHRPILHPISTGAATNAPETPASALQDFRSALLDHRNATSSHALALSPSSPSRVHREAPRRPSMEDVPEDDQPQFNSPSTPSSTHSHDHLSVVHGQGVLSHSHGQPPSPVLERGRKSRRFSFASALLDAVRSRSPKHKDEHRGRGHSKQRDASRGSNASGSRNRSPEGIVPASATRSTFSRISDMLKLDVDHLSSHHTHHHHLPSDRGRQLPEYSSESGEKWKLFKKGTYTFPISFAIPAGSPPTLKCPYGSVTWELKASVHRPGAFKSKFTAARNLTVVAYPPEDITEETENIIVERQWTDQLQYMIAISGKSFYIGGTIPVSFSFMPMSKMKIHRVSVLLEETIEYHTMMKRVARTAPVSRTLLLSLRNSDGAPILPLQSDDVDAFERSPFSAVSPPTSSMTRSELAASFMGPGPWTFHHDLELNASCRELHYSNKNWKSNVSVSHALKIVVRVERGDDSMVDSSTGKRKMFDIVVQAPVHILSCRCNPKWTTLPRYSEHFSDELDASGDGCPCQQETSNVATTSSQPTFHRAPSHADSVSSVESTNAARGELSPTTLRSALLAQNTQFERLVSGMESEFGEAPPSYESVTLTRREVVAC